MNTNKYLQVRFMRPLLLSETADDREANDGVHSLRDDMLKGLSIGYATGKLIETFFNFISCVFPLPLSIIRHYKYFDLAKLCKLVCCLLSSSLTKQ